ncbi:DUF559 domain-containing protein [Oricola sp.]|uniref:DUF559 domain-containing protein n=1 Tax=Oricola sp. TaxID=1979950 RepID=UPI003BAB6712
MASRNKNVPFFDPRSVLCSTDPRIRCESIFTRQVPLDGYILDFVCFEMRLIVEAGGDQYAKPAGLRRACSRQLDTPLKRLSLCSWKTRRSPASRLPLKSCL